MKFGGYNVSWLACVGVFVYVVLWALGGYCKYGKWKTNGFSVLIVQCHLALHPFISLSLSSTSHCWRWRLGSEALWCDIEYAVKASRPTH